MPDAIIDTAPFEIQQVNIDAAILKCNDDNVITLNTPQQLSIVTDAVSVVIPDPQETFTQTVVETLIKIVAQAPVIKIASAIGVALIGNSNINHIKSNTHVGKPNENVLTLAPLKIDSGLLITVENGTLWRII